MDSKPSTETLLWGVDFSSAPSRRKPIWQAIGEWRGEQVQLRALTPHYSLADFEKVLAEPGPWLGGFDLPLGLPACFVRDMGWGSDLPQVAQQMRGRFPDRKAWRIGIDAWRATQPAGQVLPHRACDVLLPEGARSTSPLQTRYVPVALMLYEGLPRLLASGATLPGQVTGDPHRIALEAYPGWLALRVLGRRSYKNKDDPARRAARLELLEALEQDAAGLGLSVQCPEALRQCMLDDASGDPLDALICLLQAAWASRQSRWGQPVALNPIEGWILGAQSASTSLTMASDRLSPPP